MMSLDCVRDDGTRYSGTNYYGGYGNGVVIVLLVDDGFVMMTISMVMRIVVRIIVMLYANRSATMMMSWTWLSEH